MTKETKTRVMKGVAVLALSFVLANPGEVYAEGIPKSMQGTFLESTYEINGEPNYEESQYGRYVVKKGDSASSISRKVCKYFDEEPTTKYWPVIAFLNGFPRVIQPGDVIIFPDTFEDMDELLNSLKETGWTARYIQQNDVYGRRKNNKGVTLIQLLTEIYGDTACVDPDFVYQYLKVQGLQGQYDMDSIVNGDNETLFRLTEWIPTLEELGIEPLTKPKTYKK